MKLVLRSVVALFIVAICIARGASHAVGQATSFTVIRVTSLEDEGAGTLRDCIAKGFPRVCVFEVSGRIKLSKELVITQPNLIIAGQTAPSPGILVSNAGITVKSHHVRIEHIAVRAGDDSAGPDPRSRDSLSIQTSSAYQVKLRNLSLSWGVDENFSTYQGVKDITIENSIISEGLMNSIHPKGSHSMGALVGESARNVVFRNNLLAANNDRNIRWKFDTTGAMINNVIYGWGGTSSWNTTNLSDTDGANRPNVLDVIGNRYIPGPQGLQTAYSVYSSRVPSNSRIFLGGNDSPRLTNVPSNFLAETPNFSVGTTMSAVAAYEYVLAQAGTRPWDRNPDDRRVVNGVRNRSLKLRNTVGTWPSYVVNRRSVAIPDGVVDLTRVNSVMASYEGSAGTPAVVVPVSTGVPVPSPRSTIAPTAIDSPVSSPGTTPSPSQSTAQRTYAVIKVTSLGDSGAGTLRECIERTFPRVCVFEVSGRISLKSNLVVDQPYLMVAGQTAPSPGILLSNAGLVVRSHDVRIEHLSVRSGDNLSSPASQSRKSVSVQGSSAHDITFRNLSISWAVDENVQTVGPVENVVFERCIISELLHRSNNPRRTHSMGVLINKKARAIRLIENLLAANHDGSVRWKSGTQGEMINNVIYGWGSVSGWGVTNISGSHGRQGATLLDAIGNVFLAGPQGLATAYAFYLEGTPGGTKVFLRDNRAEQLTNIDARYRVGRRIFTGAVPLPSARVLNDVLQGVGSRPWDRSADDKRVVHGVRGRTLGIRNQVMSWPKYSQHTRPVTVADVIITEEQLNQALPLFESQVTAAQPRAF